MSDNIAIKVNGIYKDFKLPHQKVNSVKTVFTNLVKKRAKSFETQHALKDISFEVKKGEFFGIVGRNGSGKSTLLKIIAEIYRPTKGTLQKNGKLVPFIELGVGFNPELTGRENVYLNGALLGFSTDEVDAMYDDIVEFAELERSMDQKLKNYSSGMQVRLAFSVATRAKADILLIDEVLAVGDADFQRKCFEYFRRIKHDKVTVVFVTHDMNAVIEYCDRALMIDGSKMVDIGSPKAIAAQYHQLFIDQESKGSIAAEQEGLRWGSGDVSYSSVEATLDGDYLMVSTRMKANSALQDVYFGVHIVSSDGDDVTATNNRLLGEPDLISISQGEEIDISWRMLNIFNDGKYTITLTAVDDAVGILDWQERAAHFTVKRIHRSTTNVLPPTELSVRRSKEKR